MTENKLYMVKDVTGHEVRLHVNKEAELDSTVEPPGFTAVVPFVSSAKTAEALALPWTERLPDAGQARETDTGSDLRYLTHTLRHMADRRDLEIEILSRKWAIGNDEELIQRQRTFAQNLRTVAEAGKLGQGPSRTTAPSKSDREHKNTGSMNRLRRSSHDAYCHTPPSSKRSVYGQKVYSEAHYHRDR